MKIKHCKDCKPPIKITSFGDFDSDGEQYYWCKKAKTYVTDKHIAESCSYPHRQKDKEV